MKLCKVGEGLDGTGYRGGGEGGVNPWAHWEAWQ